MLHEKVLENILNMLDEFEKESSTKRIILSFR